MQVIKAADKELIVKDAEEPHINKIETDEAIMPKNVIWAITKKNRLVTNLTYKTCD